MNTHLDIRYLFLCWYSKTLKQELANKVLLLTLGFESFYCIYIRKKLHEVSATSSNIR